MDALAKYHWNHLNLNRPRPFSLPNEPGVWSIWQREQRVTCWDASTATQLYFNADARQYWQQKYSHLEILDYAAICMAYKSLNLYYQLRVPKWITRRLPVGNNVSRWNPNQSSNCPRCGNDNETHHHVVTCQHPGAIARVSAWLDKLELWLVKEHTQPTLRFGIISLLRSTFRGLPWRVPNTSEPAISQVFKNQAGLLQEQVLYGWWSQGWAEVQHAYLVSLSRRTTGQRWLSRLIKKQWEIAWDLWKHRTAIAHSPDSFSLALAHDQINEEIRALYLGTHHTIYPPLQRWFRQPLTNLLQQPLAFKQDWIVMVRSFICP